MESYGDLLGYQKACNLSFKIYQATRHYPKEEMYGLISQIRRAAASIPCNIAEGYRRGYRKESPQCLHIAYGSCSELETLLTLSHDLALIDKVTFKRLYQLQEEVSRLLRGLITSLSKPQHRRS